ncbi:hypothetical protein [Curtobacterium sp. MCPF17_052]|uniref:hypothetical protein n=1 Tax=Curtobacterium sp. MCPF17_052 TaxID=2175655 RepID=UPI0024DFB76C|nr:hypothetical protein [Curtobacterium sp. MCPF17_052]WIB13256.1 hypothetical protein DEJ36_05155 [Curtobacterium sp. MCPF17_052]
MITDRASSHTDRRISSSEAKWLKTVRRATSARAASSSTLNSPALLDQIAGSLQDRFPMSRLEGSTAVG